MESAGARSPRAAKSQPHRNWETTDSNKANHPYLYSKCEKQAASTQPSRVSILTSQKRPVTMDSGGKSPSHHQSPRRLAWPRTSPFHGGNTGSNPVGDANLINHLQIPSRILYVR